MKRKGKSRGRGPKSQTEHSFRNPFHWLKKHLILITAFAAIATLYISLYSLCMAVYSLNLSAVYIERTSFETLVTSGNLEVALRRYKSASLMKLRKEPYIFFPFITLTELFNDMPNREPLWIVIRSALNHHADNYIIEGFPEIQGGGWSSSHSPGTPDKYVGINLSYVDLSETKLCNCVFTLVDLYKANLKGADLRGSDFSKAFLLETDLRNCDMGESAGEYNQFTKLYVSDSSDFLFDKAKSQFEQRKQVDLKSARRYIVDNAQIGKWIEQLKDTRWSVRYLAVCGLLDELKHDRKTEEVRESLIALLKREVTIEIDGKEYITARPSIIDQGDQELIAETYDGYFTSLLKAVAELRDSSSISILVRFDVHKYNFLVKALVDFGKPSIEPLFEILNTGTLSMRKSAATVLGNMLWKEQENYISNERIRLKIIDSLHTSFFQQNAHPIDSVAEWDEIRAEYASYLPGETSAKKNSWYENRIYKKYRIRRYIVRAFSMTEDSIVLPILEEISRSDQYMEKNKNGKIHYPVRKQAKGVIDELSRILKAPTE